MYTVSARHVGTPCCHEKADEVAAGPETRFRILCVGEGDAAGLPDEVRGTVRVREVEREKIDQTIPDCCVQGITKETFPGFVKIWWLWMDEREKCQQTRPIWEGFFSEAL